MKVTIKTVDGQKEVMDIEPGWTAGHLKNEIELVMGIPVIKQRLIYLGSPLMDEQTLEKDSVVHLLYTMS
jgi:hypothetical protein